MNFRELARSVALEALADFIFAADHLGHENRMILACLAFRKRWENL